MAQDMLFRREYRTPYGDLAAGDRVELIGCCPVAGTVAWIRDNDPCEPSGLTVHVRWDNGSTLSMRPSLGDRIRKV